ncbi:MAG TPA: YciI family protein [Candidatus Saccharimonadales bacterium]|nr:YciI family protein [Candidatus Saccharimonadales bacterium]
MRFLFVYKRGDVPQDKMKELGDEWFAWGKTINEQAGFRNAGGKIVTKEGIEDFAGNLAGVSIIEADSLDQAIELAKTNPGLKYGGKVKVLEEWTV